MSKEMRELKIRLHIEDYKRLVNMADKKFGGNISCAVEKIINNAGPIFYNGRVASIAQKRRIGVG